MKIATWTVAALGLALLVAIVLAPFASTSPDGLEAVAAGRAGFADKFEDPSVASSPLPDYEVPGLRSPRVSTAAAGAVGTLAAFGLMLGVGRLLTMRRRMPPSVHAGNEGGNDGRTAMRPYDGCPPSEGEGT